MKRAFVTGSAGFIGFHVVQKLLENGYVVIGFDNLSDYYDIELKKRRIEVLERNEMFEQKYGSIEVPGELLKVFEKNNFDLVVHLAAQAGVRYSIENPRSYFDTNLKGSFELLEAVRHFPPSHVMVASTSSVYGACEELPYTETSNADYQMSFYAATKKAVENLTHSYSHIYSIPFTMFRFFTVYGPWGRPDMAIYKFTRNIFDEVPIDVYNNGDQKRDFTYIDDIVEAIYRLSHCIPKTCDFREDGDTISPVAPWRVVNIGNAAPVELMEFIRQIEIQTGLNAKLNFLPMQVGDVKETASNTDLLYRLTGFRPNTELGEGIGKFVSWYRNFNGNELG